MVKAGQPVDDFIELLLPHLEDVDLIIDGGNSQFTDTNRRTRQLDEKGILFIGTGISGGEAGARRGPSIVPGGNPKVWPFVKDLLRDIAAKTPDGTPCCEWVGEEGAGHYVKMVHNGIEYGDMQIIAEAYQLMRDGLRLPHDEMQRIFGRWNAGELQSYLIEITRDIMGFEDADGKPAQEHDLMIPMIEGTRENFEAIGNKQDVFGKAKLTADSGFHTEANMKGVMGQGMDAYIADTQFRKRDPRFSDVDRYKEGFRKDRADYYGTAADLYRPGRDFRMSEDKTHCICPAGKRLYRNGGNVVVKGQRAVKFHGRKTDCRICELREKCLRHPDRTEARQVYCFQGRSEKKPETFTEEMKRKIDSFGQTGGVLHIPRATAYFHWRRRRHFHRKDY